MSRDSGGSDRAPDDDRGFDGDRAPDDDRGFDGNRSRDRNEDDVGDGELPSSRPYVESPIIMATVRVITPFVFTFGLFVMFHGADSSGGGFQGGVIVGTVVLMLGIAFGIEMTQDWIGAELPVVLVGLGVLAFLLTGVGSVALGGGFLEYPVYGIHHAYKYGIEFVELAIGLVVAGIVTGLFFVIGGGGFDGGGEST